jgi:hypothetical protein
MTLKSTAQAEVLPVTNLTSTRTQRITLAVAGTLVFFNFFLFAGQARSVATRVAFEWWRLLWLFRWTPLILFLFITKVITGILLPFFFFDSAALPVPVDPGHVTRAEAIESDSSS